ncbi:hypothetical protein [Cohaesibacter sp. ES.047]|uniref:hypothetical protein n=1 Tax=Cohaesibacter sp. ES.047 TaxID=1798205 RepID=UPI000BB6C1B2|nr:hypothetical protein [Cohaesibacter sp. ES.047]
MTDLTLDPAKQPRRKAGVPFVDHWCRAKGCDRWGSFGIGRGLWFCADHLAAGRMILERVPVPQKQDEKQAQGRLI